MRSSKVPKDRDERRRKETLSSNRNNKCIGRSLYSVEKCSVVEEATKVGTYAPMSLHAVILASDMLLAGALHGEEILDIER
jgi:hypothetical protein